MLLNIAKVLLEEKLLTYQSVREVLEKSGDLTLKNFQDSLINSGYIDSQTLADTISKNFGAKIEDIKNLKVDESILKLIRKETAAANLVLPLRISDSKLVVAMTNPSDLFLLDKLSFETGYTITPVIASKETIKNTLINNYNIDFEDQEIVVDSLDYSDTPENILSQLKEYDDTFEEVESYTIYNGIQPQHNDKTAENLDINIGIDPDNENSLAYNPFKSANAGILDIQIDNKNSEKEILLESEDTKFQDNNPFVSAVTIKESKFEENKTSETIEETLQLNYNAEAPEHPAHTELEEPEANTNIDSASPYDNPFQSALSKRSENEKIVVDQQPESDKNPFEIENTASEFQIMEDTDPVNLKKRSDENINATLYKKNILIVDKSATIQEIVTQTLEKKGYNVAKSSSSVDAITQINNSKPDLILIDVKLPHLDGYQLCKIIKKNTDTKDIPVIMLSGKEGIFNKMKGKMAGADAYITKPFRADILTDIVEKLTSI